MQQMMQQKIRSISEIEKVYYEEIREKKKAASGVHSKTGKNGYTGKILFPSDFMTRKEKYNHRKGGKVMTSNLYEKILPIDEFNGLETFEKRNRLAYWRTQTDNKTIMAEMGLNNSKYYDLVKELNLSTPPRKKSGDAELASKAKRVAKKIGVKAVEPPAAAPMQNELQQQNIVVQNPVQEIMVNGICLTFNGTYNAELIQKQLLKFCTLLDDEQNEFYVEFKILEKVKKK